MLLRDAVIYGTTEKTNILIRNGSIAGIGETGDVQKNEPVIELDGAVVYPGFINSHDHLDFNCYPQLGNCPYLNYTAWGHDIHKNFTQEIAAVKIIPQNLRVQWGIYKNLLNGFTTVVNHGEKIPVGDTLVNVFQDCHSLHSVAFEKGWKWRLNNPFQFRKKYVIHAGEGIDEAAHTEIDRLIRSNYLNKKLVAVHGVAMSNEQAASFKGLVWCPASNYFLLGKTAAVNELKSNTTIVFGTDSTLTASWHFKDHVKAAFTDKLVTEAELVKMLTTAPAALWGLHNCGTIEKGKDADLTILSGNNLADASLLLVIKKGEVMLIKERCRTLNGLQNDKIKTRIKLDSETLLVTGDLKKVVTDIQHFYPQAAIPFELL